MNKEQAASNVRPRMWYNSYQFPIIPVIQTRPANEHNTWSFSFEWLFIRIWSLDSFGFEIALTISEHWGVGFTVILPYLRLIFAIPLPYKFGFWVQENLWRHPKK